MQTLQNRKLVDQELSNWTFVYLNSDLPWNPESINDKTLSLLITTLYTKIYIQKMSS